MSTVKLNYRSGRPCEIENIIITLERQVLEKPGSGGGEELWVAASREVEGESVKFTL